MRYFKLFEEFFNDSNVSKLRRGDLIRVIDGGIGARIANDCIGIVIDKSDIGHNVDAYNGRLWEVDAKLYMISFEFFKKTTRFYGLCEGCEVELLARKNTSEFADRILELISLNQIEWKVVEPYVDQDFFEKHKTGLSLSSMGF